jgi:hypothetical protein
LSSIKINLSDVRQEAVKQALEQFGARPIPSSKRIINPQAKRTNIKFVFFKRISTFFSLDESSDDDEDDDGASSSTYATTTDDQHNKDSSVSPVPIPIQNYHYQNPPTVESIIKSNKTRKSSRIELFFFKDIQAPPPPPSTFLSDFIHRSQEPSCKS